jgi:phytoene dehydrogenase-like protein
MAERSILIIGAGIGGLSTGCHAQLQGYRTTILEMHSRAGGLCTAWNRGGYVFDGSIHNLAGTTPQSAFHALWRDLGVVPDIRMQPFQELVRVERPDGEPLTAWTNLERLEAHLKQLAPADSAVIDELIGAARALGSLDLMGLALAGPMQRLGALRKLPLMIRYGGITLEQFAQRFSDPFLRRAFPSLIYDWPQTPMLLLLSFLGRSHIGDLGWPAGGSNAFAQAIERRYRALGGTIRFQTRVESILVDGETAVGVRLTDGSELRADVIVSNANGHATIFDMLGGRYANAAIRRYYSAPEDRIEMGIHVSLGVDRDLSAEPHAIVLPLEPPVTIAGEERHRLYVEPFGFDASMAPKGKTVLKVVLATSFSYWKAMQHSRDRYQQEKHRVSEQVIDLLEKRFPGLRRQIEVIDVATPLTTLQITGNGHGYHAPASAMVRALFTGRRLSQTLPGLRQFYMVGQWAGIGGIPMVAAMGRDVVRAICRADRR